MPKENENPTPVGLVDAEREQRSQIVRRLMFATLLVAVLLGVLAFFDYLSVPDAPEPVVFTEPVPVPPKRPQIQPITPATTEGEPGVLGTETTPPDLPPPPPPIVEPASPAPVAGVGRTAPVAPIAAVPASPQGTKPSPAIPPVPKNKPTGKPSVSVISTEPVPEFTAPPSIEIPVDKTEAAGVAEESTATTSATQPKAGGSKKATEVPPAKPSVAAEASAAVSKFLVQAGVFSSPHKAEALQARLKKHGIPSTLETRVQLGPFKSEAEAEAARAKIKALGIEGLVLPTPQPSGR